MSLSTVEREMRKSGQLQTSTDETSGVFLKSEKSGHLQTSTDETNGVQ